MKLKPFIACIAMAALVSSCATSRPGGYIGTYENLSGGHHIEKVWREQTRIRASHYGSVELGKIDTTRIASRRGVTPNDCATWLRSSLVLAGSPETILALSDSGKSVRLDLAITTMTPGDAFTRMMIAELGAGHAWVQVEGRVVDSESGTPLITFADRRRASGVIGFRDLAGDAGPAMVREMLEAIAWDLKLELQEIFSRSE